MNFSKSPTCKSTRTGVVSTSRWLNAAAASVVAAACIGCAAPPEVVKLSYLPPARHDPVWQRIAPVAVGGVVDKRRDQTPTHFGILRSNSNREIDASQPIAALVRDSIESGLRARGALAADAKRVLTVDVNAFAGDMMFRREATIELAVTIRDSSGLPQFSKTYNTNLVEPAAPSGPGDLDARVQQVRSTVEAGLRQAVDSVLDDPALQAALLR